MSCSVTEIAILPLVPGSNIEDPSSREGEAWEANLEELRTTPGWRRSFISRHVEDKNKVEIIIGRAALHPWKLITGS